jgi:SOS-response transcriptional repressor LexA/DNA-binding phage protein
MCFASTETDRASLVSLLALTSEPVEAIERLRAAVKASGMKQAHVAAEAGMKASKLSKILRGKQVPTIIDFIAIARAIKHDPATFFSDGELVVAIEHLRTIRAAAESIGSIAGSYVPDAGAALQQSGIVSQPKRTRRRRAQPLRVAANSNVELFPEVEKKRVTIPREFWNRGARRTARAIGDSMSGDGGIEDGELVYLLPTRDSRKAKGQIIVCTIGDAAYLKKLEIIGRRVRLLSINSSSYGPIEVDRSEDLRVIGIVIGQRKHR